VVVYGKKTHGTNGANGFDSAGGRVGDYEPSKKEGAEKEENLGQKGN